MADYPYEDRNSYRLLKLERRMSKHEKAVLEIKITIRILLVLVVGSGLLNWYAHK